MKTKMSPFLIVLLIAAMWMIPCETQALLIIPDDFRSGITITETATDDPNDTDQGFPTSDRDVIVQINNEYRRYLGVVIDRTIQGQASSPVDNGDNDRLLGLGSKLVSVATLSEWARCIKNWDSSVCTFTAPNSRRYVLPVPSDAAPGSEIKFRLRLVGPAILSTSLPDSDIDPNLIRETFGWTLWEVAARDLVKLCLGGLYPDDPSIVVKFVNEFINDTQYFPQTVFAFQNGDYVGMTEGLVNWIVRSELVKNYALERGLTGSPMLMNGLKDLGKILKLVSVVELMNSFMQLLTVKWQETYEVVAVIPKINDIQQAAGGDLVTIHGLGFDPYKTTNNRVVFTGLNADGSVALNQHATEIEVSAEDTMTVRLPPDFMYGPVMVCTVAAMVPPGAYCSNTDVAFGNLIPTIISPINSASVEGSISVVAVVPSPPVPFPASVGRLLVDGGEVTRKDVTTPDFNFVLDTGTLGTGSHSLTVELITAGQTRSASIQINAATPSATLSITSPAAGSTVSGTVTVSAAIQNPPSPFPQSQARLLVDGSQRDSKPVSTSSFTFSVDAQALGAGPHTFTVEIDLAGGMLTASVQATVRTEWYPEGWLVFTTKMRCYSFSYWDRNTVGFYPFSPPTKYIIKAHPANSGRGVTLVFNSGLSCGVRVNGQIGQPVVYELTSNLCGNAWFQIEPIPFIPPSPWFPPESTCNKVEIAYPPGVPAPAQSNPQWCNP